MRKSYCDVIHSFLFVRTELVLHRIGFVVNNIMVNKYTLVTCNIMFYFVLRLYIYR